MNTARKMAALASLALFMAQPLGALANPQHDRMRNCNKTAKEKALKGDERKAFMKTCLSTKTSAAPVASAKPIKK
ncbi:PsiF family protein [Denitromonas iodatirespirans]|uniref:Phosphate starvation-inducible protein PsiF n=1 Tax=Denitromonas iodatirespirans TaxID=2795389 RepID=A0A944HET1_DENI1|nr:PsiF family protein [Denitromonas iodatirespirans]MBT0963146.1 hypothetical protein [Denitromonas iodatirespirans]